MALPHGLRALNHRPFRTFFLVQLVALVGTWMQTVSQAWLVLQLTNSPFKLGLLGTLQFGPILLLSPVAGVIADRWPPRRLLIATQAVLAVPSWRPRPARGDRAYPLLADRAARARHRPGQHARRARAAVLRDAAGRADGSRERRRAQLGLVQRGAHRGPCGRRPPDRPPRRGSSLHRQWPRIHGRARHAARPVRRPGRPARAQRRPSATRSRRACATWSGRPACAPCSASSSS